MSGEKQSFFTKENSKIAKGIAIVLMLMHHLWPWPERLPGGELKYIFNIFGVSSIHYFGGFGRICISLFLFLGGYGLFSLYSAGRFSIIERLKKLYIKYWKVLIVFLPISFLFFRNQGLYCNQESNCHMFDLISVKYILEDFLGMGNHYNGEWWFFTKYVFLIISLPLVAVIVEKLPAVASIGLVVGLNSVIAYIDGLEIGGSLPFYNYFFFPMVPCFWMGAIFARHGFFDVVNEQLEKQHLRNPFFEIVFLFVVVFLRQSSIGDLGDIVFVPMIAVLGVSLINRNDIIRKIMMELGDKSTTMWLTHTFFCYYWGATAKVIVALRWAVPCLILLVFITYVVAYVLDKAWSLRRHVV